MQRASGILRLILICVICVYLNGCSVLQEDSSDESLISISIGEAFKNDQVRVLLDEEEVFFEVITSSMMLEQPVCCVPSAVIEKTVMQGLHQLRVEINGDYKGAYEFDTQNGRFLWFTYNQETEAVRFGLSFEQLSGEG